LLGRALYRQHDLDSALEHHRQALKLGYRETWAHYELGLALRDKKDWDGAIEQFKKALALFPNHDMAHFHLGLLLCEQGGFAEGLKHLQRGQELGGQQPYWPDPAGSCIQECMRMLKLDEKLAAVLQGTMTVDDPKQLLQLASVCRRYKQYYAGAARLYGAAFAGQPLLAEKLQDGHRYRAARCAVLAATGRGKDPVTRVEQQAELRRQALDWLTADLGLCRQRALAGLSKAVSEQDPKGILSRLSQSSMAGPAAILDASERMFSWLNDPDLAGVRDARALARLPAAEQRNWRQFWAAVKQLRQQADDCFVVAHQFGKFTREQREQSHKVQLAGGKTYFFDLISHGFHAALRLQDGQGKELAASNSSKSSSGKARIMFTPSQDGIYRLIGAAVTPVDTGHYTLVTREFTPAKGKW
jgi:Tfp pilus assembly protein PilF